MYLSDKLRVELALMASLIEALMLTNIKYNPECEETLKDCRKYLVDTVNKYINTPKLKKRLYRMENTILGHFQDNSWSTRKGYMIMTNLANAINESGFYELDGKFMHVVNEINDSIVSGLNDIEIQKEDESAAKQTPRILNLLQDEGYYIGINLEVV